ncbi:MAG: methyltransferase domain-containing protein [Bacteroidota bacterium]
MYTLNNGFSTSKATERQHQKYLNELLAPTTNKLLESIHFSKRAKVLHLGCSTGFVTFQLEKKIGSSGQITGVDKNQINLDTAQEKLNFLQLPNVNFSFFSSAEWKRKSDYNVIYSRLFFNQLKHPKEVLRSVKRFLKSGGVIVIEDIDFSNYYCFPHCYAFDRYFELFISLKQRKQQDAKVGSKLLAYLKDAGFQDVKAQMIAPSFLSTNNKPITSLSLESISEELLKENLISKSELQALLFEIKDFESRSDTMITLPSIYQVSGFCP